MPPATTDEALDRLPITALRGIGNSIAARLNARGLYTVQDLLLQFPLRFQDRTRYLPIAGLRIGVEGLFIGTIQTVQLRYGQRRSLLVVVADGSGSITLRFFHFNANQSRALVSGQRILCFGNPRRGTTGLELPHPEYRLLGADEIPELESSLTPVYSLTEGVGQQRIRALIEQALDYLRAGKALHDVLPETLRSRLHLPDLGKAIIHCHHPPCDHPSALQQTLQRAHQRLAFEELLAHRLCLRVLRLKLDRRTAPVISPQQALIQPFLEHLPFTLTTAQQRVCDEIIADLGRNRPMHRLVQGDVGSGKTVVATIAALAVIESGLQVAFMAPTELLAEQHMQTLSQWLNPLGVNIAWLSRRNPAKQRNLTLARVASGDAALVTGTHALFQEQVEFAQLGLVIIDEQHRFGVHQRLALNQKGRRDNHHPHQLVMTATPIPRTLAMTAFADLDTSVIDALPPGRQPIKTAVIADSRRSQVIERVHATCKTGQQAYWVCTLIEESDALQCQAAADTALRLSEQLADLRIGLVHRRIPAAEKESTMQAFKSGQIDLLVATTVVEVGVDVPNATLMIIDNAERLGLAQLHQLRGRVGRGQHHSACVLLYQQPLSDNARQRLQAIRTHNDGFRIAQRDLELRGPGELLGTRQTGLAQLRIADLIEDAPLQPQVEQAAAELERGDPQIITALIDRWIGNTQDYGDV